MLTKEFWGILFLIFVGWVLIASHPSQRIDRVCAPVEWTGNLSTSLSALVVPQYQTRIKQWFEKVDYSCEYLVWRLIYQDTWNEYLKSRAAEGASAPSAAPQPAPEAAPHTEPAEAAGSAK